jgi:spore coat protein CotF
MANYKKDTTLNEKDTLQDMLNLEKALVKVYATAITEGCSRGYRSLIKTHLTEQIADQMDVFMLMTECGYAQVESAPKETLCEQKKTFEQVKSQLG